MNATRKLRSLKGARRRLLAISWKTKKVVVIDSHSDRETEVPS